MPTRKETDSQQKELAEEFKEFGETERKILAAAVVVFAQKGFDGARTDEIAARAGVNKAMIYYYFKSKEDLYAVIVETVFGKVSVILGAHLLRVGTSSPQEGITSFIDSYIDFIYSHRIFFRVMLWDLARGGAIVARVAGGIIREKADVLRGVFEQAEKVGLVRHLDAKHLFVSIMGMILFFFFAEPVVRVIWGEEPMTPEHIAERKAEISDLIIHGILPIQG